MWLNGRSIINLGVREPRPIRSVCPYDLKVGVPISWESEYPFYFIFTLLYKSLNIRLGLNGLSTINLEH